MSNGTNTKSSLLIAAAIVALAMPAMAQELPAFASETGTCACVQNVCNNACIRKLDPDVVAALRKRFRDLKEDDELMVLYERIRSIAETGR